GGDGLAAVVPLQHEHRVDQVVHGEAGLPHQAAHEIGAVVAAGAGVGVGAALAGKGHVRSSTAGAMLCGPAIIRKKGAPHMSIAYGCVLIAIILPFINRKSTRLNSSHVKISYAVFCLKKKKNG